MSGAEAIGPGRLPRLGAHPRGVGVDGCRGGWFFFAGHDDGFRWGLAGRFSEVLDRVPTGSPVLVDIPIGLTGADCRVRPCDTLARRRLGARGASVFPTPSRAALDCADYASASERNRQVTGRKLSRQTWNLMDKIREVDGVLGDRPEARDVVRESHPEVCLAALAGGRPMRHYKKTEPGFQERVEILCACWPGSRRLLDEVTGALSRAEAARDDVVDALALALTASLDVDEMETLPPHPGQDEAGRLMAITAPRWPS